MEIRIQLDNGHGDEVEFTSNKDRVIPLSGSRPDDMEKELDKLVERAKDWIRNV